MWYEKSTQKHQHINRFSKSKKQHYFDIMHKFINDVHHNHLRNSLSSININDGCLVCSLNLDNINFNSLLPESEIENIKNMGINNPKTLLINVNYFKFERIRQLYFYGL